METLNIALFIIILTQIHSLQISLQTANQTIYIYNQSTYNSLFIDLSSPFNCSATPLFTYSQTPTQLNNNSPYYLIIDNQNRNSSLQIQSIRSRYAVTAPNINSTICPSQQNCNFSITNNCPNPVSYFSYYDQIDLNIQNLNVLTYNVLCDNGYTDNSTFKWGIILEIIIATILITVTAIYSRAWSVKGNGITFNYWMLLVVNLLVVGTGILGYFSLDALSIVLDVFAWICAILGIWFCTNQTLFLIKGFQFLKAGFNVIKRQSIQIRMTVMDLISLITALGWAFAWWFSDKNWIINDIIVISITIAAIKLIKFTSLKVAVISLSVTVLNNLVVVILTDVLLHGDYDSLLINKVNNVFQFQLPTINPVYNQKCAWLPILAIIFPGVLLAYFRRFDSSRNTRVYLTIGVVLFLIGSTLWAFFSIFSRLSLPFGLITEPATIGLVALFAQQRKQLRTIWGGTFYDQEFADKEALKNIQMVVMEDTNREGSSIQQNLFHGLQIKQQEERIQKELEEQINQPKPKNPHQPK